MNFQWPFLAISSTPWRLGGSDSCSTKWGNLRELGWDVTETPAGYDVHFTLWYVRREMGNRAGVSRFRYQVRRDGHMAMTGEDVYLLGPYTSWQTGLMDAEAERRDAQERQRMLDFVHSVYVICPSRVPIGS